MPLSTTVTLELATDRPINPVNYYRLKIVNADGTYSYSKILAVRFQNATLLTLYPNPANGAVTVELNFPAGQILLQVVDAAGHLVRTQTLQSAGSPLTTTIDLTGLAPGAYYIKAAGETLSLIVDRRK